MKNLNYFYSTGSFAQGVNTLHDMKANQPPKLKKSKTLAKKIDYSFRHFRLGLALFFFGFVMLYSVDQLLQPSLQQEILAGLALAVVTAGFILAVIAELCFIAYRLILFFSSQQRSKE